MTVKDLMTPAMVNLSLKATTPEEAFVELGRLLAASGAVTDLDTYLDAVRAREALSTTAVGFGVAIPHGKSTGAARAAVAFGRAPAGLKWPSLDDEPVQMVFLIAAPEGAENVHLKALSQLARMLMHEEVRQRLLAADTPTALLEVLG